MSEQDLSTLEVTEAQLAKLVGVSPRRIRQLAEQGTLTRCRPGRYALGHAFAALIEEASGQGSELNRQRIRKLTADATLAELELAKAKGEVALVAEFERVQNHAMGILRTNLMLVPSRAEMQLLGELDPATFKAKLKNEIVLALRTAAETKIEPEELMEDETNG